MASQAKGSLQFRTLIQVSVHMPAATLLAAYIVSGDVRLQLPEELLKFLLGLHCP